MWIDNQIGHPCRVERTTNIEINWIMENSQQQILSEIKEIMSSIRVQLEQLDAKMAQLQNEVEPQSFMMEPIDLGLDDFPLDIPAVQEVPSVEEVPAAVQEVQQVEENTSAVQEVLQVVEEPVTLQDAAREIVQEKPAVIDSMTARQAWRTDMPGAPVRDIRSAISLNDRVLFINGLFDEDPVVFQEDLTAVNQMTALDEAVNYLVGRHPSWDLESEIVYRFMMALRRKIN